MYTYGSTNLYGGGMLCTQADGRRALPLPRPVECVDYMTLAGQLILRIHYYSSLLLILDLYQIDVSLPSPSLAFSLYLPYGLKT